ncbi:MAG: helix-turn-helix transcriptional regulator [Rhodanobacteraceae bacterium]
MASILPTRSWTPVRRDSDLPPEGATWHTQRDARFPTRTGPLRIRDVHLGSGRTVQWSGEDRACTGIVYGEGGGCRLDVADGTAGAWIPLRGTLHLTTPYAARPVRVGEIATTACTSAHVRAHAASRWLAIVGDRWGWEQLFADMTLIERQLVPGQCPASRPLRRCAIALVRAAGSADQGAALAALVDDIAALQASLTAAIARCPGRTYAQRRQVFVRLQRVRLFMAACCERELDNDALARMASYSPHHFLHTFKCIYLETPHAYLVQQRLLRARRMLSQKHLAITEIALACGFENASAFSRLFHRHFGATARQTRLQPQLGPRC